MTEAREQWTETGGSLRSHIALLTLTVAVLAVLLFLGSGWLRPWGTLLALLTGICLVLALYVYRRYAEPRPRRRT